MALLSPAVAVVLLGILGLAYWLLKQSLTQLLNRSVANSAAEFKAQLDRDLAQRKADLEAKNQEILERLRADLSRANETDLERVKAALAQQNEATRHTLQIELMKVQSAHGKKHEVYPELYEKLRRAEGAIASLRGLRQVPSYDGFGESDFEKLLSANGFPSDLRQRIQESIRSDRRQGIQDLQRVMYQMEFGRAESLHAEARNFLVLKALYAKPTLVEHARLVLQELWGAWVEADMGRTDISLSVGPQYKKHMEACQAAMSMVESEMRTELSS
jgi:hypothetical protein